MIVLFIIAGSSNTGSEVFADPVKVDAVISKLLQPPKIGQSSVTSQGMI